MDYARSTKRTSATSPEFNHGMEVFPSGWWSVFLPELDPLPSERIDVLDRREYPPCDESTDDLSEPDTSRELSLNWSRFVLDPFLVMLLT